MRLRDSARTGSTDLGGGLASPVGGGWRLVLEAAAGKIIGSTGLAAARPPPRDSGTPAGRGRPTGG
ncbi:hypothetical protein ACFV83_18785 [Streptomyces pharetrae]|uniref:hypothetical protein n=1 Tax=Streptomyces pharetrae TaxID=291370 RepID=UPI003460A726